MRRQLDPSQAAVPWKGTTRCCWSQTGPDVLFPVSPQGAGGCFNDKRTTLLFISHPHMKLSPAIWACDDFLLLQCVVYDIFVCFKCILSEDIKIKVCVTQFFLHFSSLIDWLSCIDCCVYLNPFYTILCVQKIPKNSNYNKFMIVVTHDIIILPTTLVFIIILH